MQSNKVMTCDEIKISAEQQNVSRETETSKEAPSISCAKSGVFITTVIQSRERQIDEAII
jgi:hypothetical protein